MINLPIILTCLSVGLILFAWWCDIRQLVKAHQLKMWVKAHHPVEWDRLPWLQQKIRPEIGLAAIQKNRTIPEQEFGDRYRDVRRQGWAAGGAAILGLIMLSAAIFGVHVWGW